jgi:hypothetical protein
MFELRLCMVPVDGNSREKLMFFAKKYPEA